MNKDSIKLTPPDFILTIKPPKVLGLMDPNERCRSVLLLGLNAKLLENDCLQLLLNLVFRPIGLRRGAITPSDYYVATTGAFVSLVAPQAGLLNYTTESRIVVEYDVGLERDIEHTHKLSPDLNTKVGSVDLAIKPGSVTHRATDTRSSRAKFASTEMLLVPVDLGDSIEWRIDSHRAEKAIRDFLTGNVHLEAKFRWRTAPKSGSAEARPTDISFFDNERRRLSRRASILMRYILWRRNITIANPDGIRVNFAERKDDRS